MPFVPDTFYRHGLWGAICGLAVGIGIAIFKYRTEPGWLAFAFAILILAGTIQFFIAVLDG